MRPNRYVILVSVLLGLAGSWFAASGVEQYLDATRSFTSVHISYVDGSFEWLDDEHERGVAQFTLVNDAPNDVTIGHLALNLLFDGEFAGAHYQSWERIEIPSGESVQVELPLLVSISHLRPLGAEATLSVRGQMRLEFDGIERSMTVRYSETIGRVSQQEAG